MSDIGQRVKYAIEVDASDLGKFGKILEDARASVDKMLGSVAGLANAFNNMGGKVLKVKVAQQQLAATNDTVKTAVVGAKQATEGLDAAMEQLEKELQQAAKGSNALSMAVKQNDAVLRQQARAAVESRNRAKQLALELQASGRAVDFVNKKMDDAAKATDGMGQSLSRVNVVGTAFLKVFGKFQATKWIVTETMNAIREGAQNLDIRNTLQRQIAGFDSIVAEINTRTAGTIKEADLNKSLALMTSFGLETASLPRSMELVAKAAIRTGQSTEFLTESFARGVSRMSPLILDNLGIQLKLSDAYDAFAKKVGKASDALTKNEQIAAVQQATLEALEKTTQGINLDNMASGSVARFDKFVDDAWLAVKEAGGAALQSIERAIESTEVSARRLAAAFKNADIAALSEWIGGDDAAMQRMSNASDMMSTMSRTLAGFKELSVVNQEGILNMFLFGVGDPAQGAKRIDDAIKNFSGNVERIRNAVGERFMGGGNGPGEAENMFAAFSTAAYQAAQTEIEIAAGAAERALGEQLTVTDKLNIQAAARAEAEKRVAGALKEVNRLLNDETTNRGDLAVAAQRVQQLDNQRVASFVELIKKTVEARKQSEELTRQSAAYVVSVEDGLVARARELEYADKTHILQIDANKAREREQALTKQIGETLKDIRDEEKAAEKGANIARLKQLEAVRRIAVAQTDAARKVWELEDARLTAIIKAGKAAVQAEIARLEAMVKQNQTLMQQYELFKVLYPAFAGMSSTVLSGIKDQTESAIDSIARLRAELDGMGRGGRGPRTPREPAEKETKPKKALFGDPTELMDAYMRQIRMANVELAERDFLGIGQSKLGASLEMFEAYKDGMGDILKAIKDEFVSMENFAALYFKGDEAAMKKWLAEMQPMIEYLDAFDAHAERLRKFGEEAAKVSVALESMNDGLAGLGDAFGTDGDKYVRMLSDLSTGFETFTKALTANGNAYELVGAAMPMIAAFSRNLIKDLRGRAAVEGAMQTALSAAAFATGNIPGGVAHAAAAALFFGVAGLGKSGKQTKKQDTPSVGGAGNMRVARSDVHVHITGTVVQSEAERGVMIQRAIREARAGGR